MRAGLSLQNPSDLPLLAQLILPYLNLDIKYYDLGLEYRDAVRKPHCLCPPPDSSTHAAHVADG